MRKQFGAVLIHRDKTFYTGKSNHNGFWDCARHSNKILFSSGNFYGCGEGYGYGNSLHDSQ